MIRVGVMGLLTVIVVGTFIPLSMPYLLKLEDFCVHLELSLPCSLRCSNHHRIGSTNKTTYPARVTVLPSCMPLITVIIGNNSAEEGLEVWTALVDCSRNRQL